jgi:hypothetical protein
MTNIKGGKGLHGPDKQQDALRDGGSHEYGKGGPNTAPHPNEATRTKHQQMHSGADLRQGVPDAVRKEDSDLPEGLLRKRMGPLNKDTGRGH